MPLRGKDGFPVGASVGKRLGRFFVGAGFVDRLFFAADDGGADGDAGDFLGLARQSVLDVEHDFFEDGTQTART